MLTPLAYVNNPALTLVTEILPALILPVTPTPPVTCNAPLVVLVLGVPETICKSLRLCGLVGLALLTDALV